MNARNEIKINEKIIHLKNHLTEFYPRSSFLKVEIKENGHTTKSFLAVKKKQTFYFPNNKKEIRELIPKNNDKWFEKTTKITEINDKSSKISEKDLLYTIENDINKPQLSREFYIKKNKTVYTLPNFSKIITEIYPEKDKMIFEIIEEK